MRAYAILIVFTLVALTAQQGFAGSKYQIDDVEIESIFEEATEVGMGEFLSNAGFGLETTTTFDGQQMMFAPKDGNLQLVAGIVAIAELVFGIGILIPVHRIILGMGGNGGTVVALYCITLGGCGWITLIDGISLLMNSGGDQFIDNPKFIMW